MVDKRYTQNKENTENMENMENMENTRHMRHTQDTRHMRHTENTQHTQQAKYIENMDDYEYKPSISLEDFSPVAHNDKVNNEVNMTLSRSASRMRTPENDNNNKKLKTNLKRNSVELVDQFECFYNLKAIVICISQMITVMAYYGNLVESINILHYNLWEGPVVIGLVLSSGGVGVIVGALIFSCTVWWYRKYNMDINLNIWGFFGNMIALCFALCIPFSRTTVHIALYLCVSCIGSALTMTIYMLMMSDIVRPGKESAYMGTLAISSGLGRVLQPIISLVLDFNLTFPFIAFGVGSVVAAMFHVYMYFMYR